MADRRACPTCGVITEIDKDRRTIKLTRTKGKNACPACFEWREEKVKAW